MGDGQVVVSPDTLRSAGQDIVATADELKRDLSAVVGEQDADAGANRPFAAAQAEGACESGWEQALSVLGAALAIAGDKLTLNAANYAGAERVNHARFGPR